MISDKRRYVSRNPRPGDKIYAMEDDVSGNAAADGFTARYRKPLKREAYPKDNPFREDYACHGLMNEDEMRLSDSIYNGDY